MPPSSREALAGEMLRRAQNTLGRIAREARPEKLDRYVYPVSPPEEIGQVITGVGVPGPNGVPTPGGLVMGAIIAFIVAGGIAGAAAFFFVRHHMIERTLEWLSMTHAIAAAAAAGLVIGLLAAFVIYSLDVVSFKYVGTKGVAFISYSGKTREVTEHEVHLFRGCERLDISSDKESKTYTWRGEDGFSLTIPGTATSQEPGGFPYYTRAVEAAFLPYLIRRSAEEFTRTGSLRFQNTDFGEEHVAVVSPGRLRSEWKSWNEQHEPYDLTVDKIEKVIVFASNPENAWLDAAYVGMPQLDPAFLRVIFKGHHGYDDSYTGIQVHAMGERLFFIVAVQVLLGVEMGVASTDALLKMMETLAAMNESIGEHGFDPERLKQIVGDADD